MATPDAQMNLYLNTIKNAVKGREVRSALHNSIEKAYNDSYRWADSSLGNANQALAKATEALETVSTMSEDINEAVEKATHADEGYTEVSARVNNIIAHNNDTEGNSELIDIRTGFDGYVATAAGSSVRRQVNTVNERVSNLVLNNPRSQVAVNKPASISYELLWENESPDVAFTSTTITFTPVDDTMELLLVYKINTSGTDEYSDVMAMPIASNETKTKRIDVGDISAYGVSVKTRDFKVGTSSIEVSACSSLNPNNPFSLSGTDMTIVDPTASETTDNTFIIPLRIYAVKHVLDTVLEVPKDTELLDARVGIDGVTYDTVGDAIRSQIGQYIASGVLEALNGTY